MKLDFNLILAVVIGGVIVSVVTPMLSKLIGGDDTNAFESHD